MSFGLGEREEHGGTERRTGNRPDCAYFLLLGLCGAAFLLTIGGILTYIAFNPGSVDVRPHSPLSHIPHFHHHRKHHDRTEGHYFGHFEQHNYHHDDLKQQHPHPSPTPQQHHNSSNVSSAGTTLSPPNEKRNDSETSSIQGNGTETAILTGANGTTPGSHLETARVSGGNSSSSDQHQLGQEVSSASKGNNSSHKIHHPLLQPASNSNHHLNHHPHPGLAASSAIGHHHNTHNSSSGGVDEEYQAKESLALAIIGGLCLTCGVQVTIIVGVFALKYDCDHEPEPNIAFLRLRSEMSLNFDPSKNNYELLMPATSASTAAGVGSTHSIHPGGMPRC